MAIKYSIIDSITADNYTTKAEYLSGSFTYTRTSGVRYCRYAYNMSYTIPSTDKPYTFRYINNEGRSVCSGLYYTSWDAVDMLSVINSSAYPRLVVVYTHNFSGWRVDSSESKGINGFKSRNSVAFVLQPGITLNLYMPAPCYIGPMHLLITPVFANLLGASDYSSIRNLEFDTIKPISVDNSAKSSLTLITSASSCIFNFSKTSTGNYQVCRSTTLPILNVNRNHSFIGSTAADPQYGYGFGSLNPTISSDYPIYLDKENTKVSSILVTSSCTDLYEPNYDNMAAMMSYSAFSVDWWASFMPMSDNWSTGGVLIEKRSPQTLTFSGNTKKNTIIIPIQLTKNFSCTWNSNTTPTITTGAYTFGWLHLRTAKGTCYIVGSIWNE